MSTEHPDLVSYLRGELGNVAVLEASAHLEGCGSCRQELLEVATGHALLAASARTLRRPARTGASDRTGSAAPSGANDPDGEAEVRVATAKPVGLPAPVAPAPVPPPRWRRPLALAAAAVVLVAGAVVASPLVGGDGPGAQDEQRAVLAPVVDPLDPDAGGTGSGEVVMTGAADAVQMQITTADLPRPAPGEYYYAWLLAPDQDKLLALGVVDPESGATFAVPPDLVEQYDVVDVSLERDDGDPSHSLISVLRGDYAAGDLSS